jgi:hypothetical protein
MQREVFVTTWAIGDSQAPAARFFDVLRSRGLLDGGDGLTPDATLVSIGDHFDFGPGSQRLDEIARDGLRILRWLGEQAGARVLFGNHDVSRVGELWRMTDEEFARARAEALPIEALRKERGADDPEVVERTAAFLERWPDVPTTELVARDYSAFTTEQRALVIELLLNGRARLALAAELADGREVLLTHAGVTQPQLEELGLTAGAGAREAAAAINGFLDERVARVRERWQRGEPARLDLAPLHCHGRPGEEGGGMLYHRPTNWDRPRADAEDLAWQRKLGRRFAPSDLPAGLVQACGHVRHSKCLQELDGWIVDGAERLPAGALRKLVVDEPPRYGDAQLAEPEGAAVLWFIDGAMAETEPVDYELLPLSRLLEE